MAGSRVTWARLMASAAMPGGLRVTWSHLLASVGQPGPMRITHFRLLAAIANRPGLGMRVTNFRWIRAQSPHRAFYLEFLESASVIYGLDVWTIALTAGPIPEFNPWKPQVPESLINIEGAGRDLFDYIEENQKTQRLQHNITQAGDTTFPWQMIQTAHSDKLHTLGSISRFYHEDFGLIIARYVKFDKMDKTVPATAPVGLITNTGQLDWVVTNRIEISSPHLVVGVSAPFITPEDGQYGWVIVDGVNLQPLDNLSETHELAETFVWTESGKIKNSGPGVVLARRLNESTSLTISIGQLYIRVESFSRDTLVASLQGFLDDITKLKEDVANLQAAEDIEAFTATLANLKKRLTLEENTRRAADIAINQRISAMDAVTQTTLDQAIALLQNTLETAHQALVESLASTHAIALEALQKANQALSLNLDAIVDQISAILAMMAAETIRPKGRFPVVDGAVPPNLVYMDDGSLVYTETF